jgi:hypothetical protein
MHDNRSRALSRILENGEPGGEKKPYTSERQHTAQAFNLHVERKDGLKAEGFPWALYGGYEWNDNGDRESLTVLFGNRAIEIEGHNLGLLVDQIREGHLNGIRELVSRKATLLEQENHEGEPIIMSVKSYPDFSQILREIKGEEDDDRHRHARRAGG